MTTKSGLSKNRLLAELPPDQLKRLQPHLQLIHCPLGQVLYHAGQAIDYAYFPDDAVISLLVALESGRSVEVTLIGNEGILGVAAAMGEKTAPNRAVAQIPGDCWKIKAEFIRSEFKREGVLRDSQNSPRLPECDRKS